jgi:hypothetical protein
LGGNPKISSGIFKREFLASVAPAHEKETQEKAAWIKHAFILGVLLDHFFMVTK